MPDEEEPTEEEVEEALRTFSEEKANIHTFLTKVIREKDNTKIGNVTEPELGNPSHTVRMYKELEVFCKGIDMEEWADYFNQMAQVPLATGLSKDGFLLQLAVIQKRELTTGGKKAMKQNRGWFRPKRTAVEEE